MLISIVLLPLLGFLFSSLFGKVIGRGATILSTGSVALACCLSINLFLNLLETGSIYTVFLAN
tara:strand:- start:36 stop:224 length:189 start_codon:yes stop_codon:yes gene_type:complete